MLTEDYLDQFNKTNKSLLESEGTPYYEYIWGIADDYILQKLNFKQGASSTSLCEIFFVKIGKALTYVFTSVQLPLSLATLSWTVVVLYFLLLSKIEAAMLHDVDHYIIHYIYLITVNASD